MKYQRLSVIAVLIILFLSPIFLIPGHVWGEEEKKPDFMSHKVTITQVGWINNNEILIGQRDLSNSSMGDRIIKYNVRENEFLPVYNENFEREETLGFSKDGKTLFIYDEKNGTVSLKRNGKIIYWKDFAHEAHTHLWEWRKTGKSVMESILL